MAGKFIELKAAAKQLGITPERLGEMREAGEIHGYRDGASWKFKVEEVERVAKELAAGAAAGAEDDFSLSDSVGLSGDDLDGLLDVSDSEELETGLEGSSIVIGADKANGSAIEASGTHVGPQADDEELKLADEDEDLALAPEEPQAAADSKDVDASDSELRLADSSEADDELELSDELEFDSDDALSLGEASDAKLGDSSESEIVVNTGSESDIPLAPLDSSAGDSASDSGLSLESAPDGLSSSGALELPEEDEMISLDDELVAAADDATIQQDEEFLLSPSGEGLGEESDSGSQVIALEESDSFVDAAVGEDSEEALLEPDESGELGDQLEAFDGATAVEAGALPLGAGELPEAPYSIWNIISLLLIMMLLTVTGMLMTDIVRNMWSWSGSSNMTSGIADALVSIFGMQ